MIALILFIVTFAALVAALAYIWWLHGELDRLHGSHARPRERGAADAARPDGAVPAGYDTAGPAPDRLPVEEAAWQAVQRPEPAPEWHQETPAAAHANAMWQASEPHLPKRPRPGTLAARTIPVAQTASAPPWETPTGVQPAVDEVAEMHAEYLRSYFEECLARTGEVTREDMEAARDALRNLPERPAAVMLP